MLNSIIPTQNFELIRDAIGRVLTLEFANQYNLVKAYNEAHEDDAEPVCIEPICPTIWLERVCPFDKEELPAINIVYADTDFTDETTAYTSRGDNKYYIELYTNAPSTIGMDGDKAAAIQLAKLAGMVRAILMDNKNRNLDFINDPIHSRYVKTITRTQPRISNDAENTISGIVEAHYIGEESTETEPGIVVAESSTAVKLSETDKGYKYELITT